jgi:glycosyltransferase involved in cell wall biosynthesis
VFLRRYPAEKQAHDPKHLVWASSPDRGLHHLVDIFKLVQAEVPDARLTICYDFDRAYKNYHEQLPGSAFVRHLERAAELKSMPGVELVQHISQPKLAELFLSAGMLVYPCDPIRATETYCTTVNDALAAGLPVLISDADCLPENFSEAADVLPRPIDHEAWASEILYLIKHPDQYEQASVDSLLLAKVTDVAEIAEEWERFFIEFLDGHETTSDRSLAARLGK